MSRLLVERKYGKESIRTVLGHRQVVQPCIRVEDTNGCGDILWTFSANGWQGTSATITPQEFSILQQLVNDARIVEYYEKLREKDND